MIKMTWKIGLFCALLLPSTLAARADETPVVAKPEVAAAVQAEQAPKDWLAFLAYRGGYKAMESYILDQTPYIILFQDGRLLWRDDNIKYDAPNRRRDMWREATVAPEALKAFVAKAKDIEFLTVQPPPEVAPVPDENGMITLSRPVIIDAATTVLGLQERLKNDEKQKNDIVYYQQRIVSEYALGAFGDEDKNNRYIQSLLTMEKMLQELRPKESRRYEPESVRVNFMDSNSRGSVRLEPDAVVAAWPFKETPDVEKANIFSGEQAKILVEMLTKNPLVKVGDAIYTAIWTPAVSVPEKFEPIYIRSNRQ